MKDVRSVMDDMRQLLGAAYLDDNVNVGIVEGLFIFRQSMLISLTSYYTTYFWNT